MIDIDGAVRILQASGHMASAQRIMALYNDIERQSELIAALRLEIATKDKRIAELEAQLAVTLATIEAAACDGRIYSEGCKP